MKKLFSITLVLMLLVGAQIGFAQKTTDLFMTKQLKKAYKNQTRDTLGEAGNHYWQNHADYQIKAELIPEERRINGSETITYSNNSPDSLRTLYFNLYQDLYKKGTARDWDIGPVDITDGVEIKLLKINDLEIDLSKRSVFHNASIMGVVLMNKIPPKAKTKIEIVWSVILPGTINIRMGTYDKTNFMVGYWYPRVVVYDDIYGWNKIPFVGNCEFYNDFCNYEVELSLPDGFLAWSSGLLQNEKELLSKTYLKRLEKARMGDAVVHVITEKDRNEGKLFQKKEAHIWKFKAENLVDFAFAASDSYLWDATSFNTGKKRVWINTVYKKNSTDFATVADIAWKSLDFYTHKVPGIVFPFPQITLFNGHEGMEFPGMVNNGDNETLKGTLYVTSHEIGHSYFPFSTGLNEQLYAWMDEGMITYLSNKFVGEYTNDSSYIFVDGMIKSYNYFAGGFNEIPLMIPSTNTGKAYRYQAYSRSSIAFYMLNEYLGDTIFNQGLQLFTERWKGKHPTPFDFFITFNEVAKEDLGWFWKPWFFDLGYADLSLKSMNSRGFIIENKGGFPVPVHLTIEFKNGRIEQINEPASIWKNGKKTNAFQFNEWEIESLKLDTQTTPDAFPKDNVWKAK